METLPGSTKTEMVVNRKCKFARTSSQECGAWLIFTFSSSLLPPLLSASSSSSRPSILPFTLLSGAPYSPSVGFTSPHPWPQFSLTFWRDPGFCDGINFCRARYPVLSCLWLSLWSSAQPSSSLLIALWLVVAELVTLVESKDFMLEGTTEIWSPHFRKRELRQRVT